MLDFSFRNVENLFTECVPLTFRLISALCGVREGEHAGNHTYLTRQGSDQNLYDSADEIAGMAQGWDEDDEWQDEVEGGLESMDGSHSWSPSQDVGGIGQGITLARNVLRVPQQQQNRDNGQTSKSILGQEEEGASKRKGVGEKCRRSRRTRNRVIIATTVHAQMLYASNQSANAFQAIMAAYTFASRMGKRVTGVLNQLGLSVSPTTFANSLKQNASDSLVKIISGIQEGRKPALFYDNLVIYD